MNALTGLPTATGNPIASRMVIAGCTRRKAAAGRAIPALELYQGGCVPALRARLGGHPLLRARVRFLSAEHGLITADTPLPAYDRPLDPARAAQLRPAVARAFADDGELPYEAMVIAEPPYLVMLADLLATATRIRWIPDVQHGWDQAAGVLDRWGWP